MKRIFPLLILFQFLLNGCGTSEHTDSSDISIQQQLVLRYVNSGWNGENLAALSNLFSEDYIRNLNGIEVADGATELEAYIQNYQSAFPNLRITVNHMLEADMQVATFWTFEGINTGEFGEIIPTGKKASVSGVSLFTFDPGGRIVQEDTYYNELYLLQQLGYNLNPPNLE